ncbi:hypothetical protein GLYMA_04G204050v4 [Glycine max]|nr:hypothetical protein GLYMA_04G204050v4 [Glycine max]KAH1112348.1 hypothetical protein GYH30_010568 [Glycine max]
MLVLSFLVFSFSLPYPFVHRVQSAPLSSLVLDDHVSIYIKVFWLTVRTQALPK